MSCERAVAASAGGVVNSYVTFEGFLFSTQQLQSQMMMSACHRLPKRAGVRASNILDSGIDLTTDSMKGFAAVSNPSKIVSCKHNNWGCVRKSSIYHAIHCCAFVLLIVCYDLLFGKAHRFFGCWTRDDADVQDVALVTWAVYYVRFASAIGWMPYVVMMTGGLFFFNAYETEVECKVRPSDAPFLCFRVVTRGLYPKLVSKNVRQLLNLCSSMSLKNFAIQIVTDLHFDLQGANHPKVKLVVVPERYQTRNGSLYKARALQYCLESSSLVLKDNDWIVHLDEETVVTASSVRGILNFVTDGRYQFGEGLITYIGDHIDNWFTSLLDAWRVGDDLGKQRFQLSVFHRLVLEWKGSFFVCKAGAEKAITFDHGKVGSIVEDAYFGLKASQNDYKFNFIEGNMWERSPSSVWDLLQQRKRWAQGGLPIVQSPDISAATKFFFTIHFCTIWLTLGNAVVAALALLFPVPFPSVLDVFDTCVASLLLFLPPFGVLYSYLLYPDRGVVVLVVTMVLSVAVIPVNNVMLSISILMATFGKKGEFYIVKKYE